MSAFQNSYLAESVGYNNGHALGHQQGVDKGYAAGWNEATEIGNNTIAKLRQRISHHESRCAVLERDNRQLDQNNAGLLNSVERVCEENQRLQQQVQLLQEQAASLRSEYEAMFKAFLGVVSMAGPAIEAVAKMPFEEKDAMVGKYAEMADNLLSKEYIDANKFPHNQPLIKQYLPVASSVIKAINTEANQREKDAAAKPEAAH